MVDSVPGRLLVDADNGAACATTVTVHVSAPEALPLEPLEFPLGDNMDLAAIRVKVQRLSDELAAALVSLEELVLAPTAVVRDADCQTEVVSVAEPTPSNTDLSAAERAGALVNIVDEVQRHLEQVQGFMETSSNIQSDWVHVRKSSPW